MHVPGWLQRYVRPMVRAADMLDAMCNLPFADCRDLVGEQPLLVLAPHPDDETFGCGGLIAECRCRGQPVYVLVLTDGSGSHPGSRDYTAKRLVALRAAEAREAVRTLGVPEDHIGFLGVRDGHLGSRATRSDAIVADIVRFAGERGVQTIVTTWERDPHPDHRAAYRLGVRAARQLGARLLRYPVWGWTIPPHAWLPRVQLCGARIGIDRQLAVKRQAIARYRSQVTDLIQDDPGGFCMPPEIVALFHRPFEVFLGDPNGR